MNRIVLCHYCMAPAELVGGDVIYPHRADLANKLFYRCEPCGAYVGCHDGTDKPLGRLADAELRAAKSAAHRAFDPLWRSKQMKRSEAYKWLAEQLGIEGKDCHIGMFDVETCWRAVRACGV